MCGGRCEGAGCTLKKVSYSSRFSGGKWSASPSSLSSMVIITKLMRRNNPFHRMGIHSGWSR